MQSKKIQCLNQKEKKNDSKSIPITQEYICSEKMFRLSDTALDRFSNDYELIYCAEYLNN